MKAVMYGAGNVGRGFIAELLAEAGLEVTFLDVNQSLVDAINRQGSYRQVIVGAQQREKLITGVRAVNCMDESLAAVEICSCDLLATSVGAGILPRIAPVIAAGLQERWKAGNETPLNIFICENLNHADKFLKNEIRSHLTEADYGNLDELVGFVETSIGRMIPVMSAEMMAKDPSVICVEPYRYLPYDCAAVKGTLPEIPMTVPFSPFPFYVERKLFVHNMGHFLCALLGRMKGYDYIWQSVEDAEIYHFVRAAMEDSALALSKKYATDYGQLMAHVDDLLYRFSNKALGDTNERVGRDLPRKLAPDDRLLGAVRMCGEQAVFSGHVCLGIAAAYHFLQAPPEGQSAIVQELWKCLKDGFDYRSIQQIIRQYQHAEDKMIV